MRIDFRLSLRNAIIRARQLEQMGAAADGRAFTSTHEPEAGFSRASHAVLPKSPTANETVSSETPTPLVSMTGRSALSRPASATASAIIGETIAERPLRAILSSLISPMKRVVKRIRNVLLTPLHTQLDGLQLLIYSLHEKVDDAQNAQEIAYSLHQKLDEAHEILYSLHEKLDDAHVKIDDAYAKLEEMHRTVEDAHVETTVRLNQLDELTQAIDSRLEEIALRARTPLRIDDSTFSLRTYDGFVLAPTSDHLLLLTILDAGPQGPRPGTRTILQKLLGPGMMFIDVGASLGLLTLAGARAVGPKGRVLAIEPNPSAFELLTRALRVNEIADRVVAKCLAAGERRERGELHTKLFRGRTPCSGLDRSEPTKLTVDVVPLDDLVGKGERVDVVKITPKGAGLQVLRGMSQILRDNSDLAIIAEFSATHLKELTIDTTRWFSAFSELGFDPYLIDELSGECLRLDLEVGTVDSTNVLFLRPSSLAMSRVF